jgi:hypothetical protein
MIKPSFFSYVLFPPREIPHLNSPEGARRSERSLQDFRPSLRDLNRFVAQFPQLKLRAIIVGLSEAKTGGCPSRSERDYGATGKGRPTGKIAGSDGRHLRPAGEPAVLSRPTPAPASRKKVENNCCHFPEGIYIWTSLLWLVDG